MHIYFYTVNNKIGDNMQNNKKILLYIIFTIILSFIFFKFKYALNFIIIIFNLISPIIYGFIIAYFLNIIMKLFEKRIKNRKLNIFLSILVVVLIILLTFIVLIPQITEDINIISKNTPNIINNIKEFTLNKIGNNNFIKDNINKINIDFKDILKYFKLNYKGYIFSSIKSVKNTFNIIINIFLGMIISIIMLYNKEKYIKIIKNILKSKLKKEKYIKLINILHIANEKFEKYFVGQFITSLFISIITFIGMLILKIPYSLSISVLLFTLSLIPVIGTALAVILSILLLLAISFKKTIYFAILIFVVKQLNDYLIRPKVFEKNLDLPSIIIVLSVVYFALNFGLIGAIVAIPISAVLYELYQKYIRI